MLFPDTTKPVIIMCDVEYSYAAESLTAELAKTYEHIIPTKIQTESKLQSTLGKAPSSNCCSSSNNNREQPRSGCCGNIAKVETNNCCGNGNCEEEKSDVEEDDEEAGILPPSAPIENVDELKEEMKRGGRYFELPENITIEDCSIFFVGKESLTLTNILMVHNKCPVRSLGKKSKMICIY